jgi:hypothetical protein
MYGLLPIVALTATLHCMGVASLAAARLADPPSNSSAAKFVNRNGALLAGMGGGGGGAGGGDGGSRTSGGGIGCGADRGVGAPQAKYPDHQRKSDHRHLTQTAEKTDSAPAQCSDSR